MKIGSAISYGNTGDNITVQLPNGKIVNAIAGNEINSSKVLITKERGVYYSWSETTPITVLQKREGIQILPKEIAAVEPVLLPFQILFNSSLQLGGDRNQLGLSEFSPVVAGINNLGEQRYLAVWQEGNQIVRDSNGILATVNAPDIDYSWLGFGILAGLVNPVIPDEDLTETVTGDALPFDFDVPLYPVFTARSDQDRDGITTNEQSETGYIYNQIEDYEYLNQKTGNAPNPTPSPLDIIAVCNFTTSGAFETQEYIRSTSLDYLKTINETLNNPVEVWFNGTLYTGDRIESYTETYDYDVTPAVFSTSTSFNCVLISGDPVFGFYDWQAVGATQGNWSGETSTIDRTYNKNIEELQWERPITPTYSRIQGHNYNQDYTELTIYTVPSNSWSVPVGSFFQFETPGTETQDIDVTTTETRTLVTPLLLSGDGNSALFIEIDSSLNQTLESDRIRDIAKFLFDNSTAFPTPTSHIEVTTVEQSYDERFYLYNQGNLVQIDLDDSWVFSIQNSVTLDLGQVTLSNGNSTAILTEPTMSFTEYTKTEDKVADNIIYSDVISVDRSFWDNINLRSVYILSGDKRYTGVILSHTFEDNPNPELEIEILRSLLSVTIEITGVTDYPIGLAATGEIIIIPQDNVSKLVRDVLLNSKNKNYCNLVGDALYFAKSVEFDLENEQQQSEVYLIGNTVTQETPETGAFIPVTGVSEVLGISYYPQ